MDPIYVYSTLTNDQMYGPWVEGGGDMPSKPKRVLIYGGANRADRDNRVVTPLGVATRISEEDLRACEADPVFLKHQKRGYIYVDSKEVDPDHVAADMEGRSKDAPITRADIDAENETKPDDKRIETVTNVPPATGRVTPNKRQGGARKPGARN